MRGGAFVFTGGGEKLFFLAIAKHSVPNYMYAPVSAARAERSGREYGARLWKAAPHSGSKTRDSFNCRRAVVCSVPHIRGVAGLTTAGIPGTNQGYVGPSFGHRAWPYKALNSTARLCAQCAVSNRRRRCNDARYATFAGPLAGNNRCSACAIARDRAAADSIRPGRFRRLLWKEISCSSSAPPPGTACSPLFPARTACD